MNIHTAESIAHWFADNYLSNWNGGQPCEGLEIERDGHDYCYAWMCAYVDRDLQIYFLLDIRTYVDGVETRDYLYISTGTYGERCQFQQAPVRFEDDTPTRLYAGIRWMIELMESDVPEKWSLGRP